MNRITVLLTAAAAFRFVSFASAPVATVSSAEPVTLAGHSVSAPGVSSWPLVTGDEIATSTAPATILFRDGSSVALSARSSARLTGTSTQPKLVLIAGSLNYKIVPGSKLALSRSEAGNDEGSAVDQDSTGSPSGPPSAAATISAPSISTGSVVAGVLVAAGVTMIIPIQTLTQASPTPLPSLSTH